MHLVWKTRMACHGEQLLTIGHMLQDMACVYVPHLSGGGELMTALCWVFHFFDSVVL